MYNKVIFISPYILKICDLIERLKTSILSFLLFFYNVSTPLSDIGIINSVIDEIGIT